jgi:signal transduction histidine kinase
MQPILNNDPAKEGDFRTVTTMPEPTNHSSRTQETTPAHSGSELFNEVIDYLRNPLLILGTGMQVIYANRAYCNLFQVTQAQIEQRGLYDLDDHFWDIPAVHDLLEQAWAQETPPSDIELQCEFPRIGRKTFLLYARPLFSQDGSRRISLEIEDISERRSADEQAQAHVHKLERSNLELQDFAYVASHDLLEPLRAIQSFGERLNLQLGEELNSEARDSLDRILKAAKRMRGLINELLELSRITTKARQFSQVDLNEIAQAAISDLSKRLQESGGSVDLQSMPDIDADSTQMRQLLQNLIDNGLKFAREGIPPVVTVCAEIVQEDVIGSKQKMPMCRIEVQDNGIGFEDKYAERIFVPFQRLPNREKYVGTGIGLALCRKIVDRHGGYMTAQSALNEGSLFTVMLPVKQLNEK